MGLVVRGIRRGAGRMLGMEIQAPAGEEGGKPEGVGTHRSGVRERRGMRSGRRVRGARRGSARSGCALCPGAPLTVRRRRPPALLRGEFHDYSLLTDSCLLSEEEAAPRPPTQSLPHLLSTSTAVCEGGAKSRTGFPSQILGWISWNLDSSTPTLSPLP